MIDPRLEGKPVPRYSVAEMERDNVARIDTMRGSDLAFLDQRVPGHEREIINVIGMGVTENVTEPVLAPKIGSPAHGFAITYVRAGDTKGAALHRHPTEEVFTPIHGIWEVYWLEGEEERSLMLEPGDVINVPIGVFRGFRATSNDPDDLLMAIFGGPDPGKVDWHPSVIENARATGLVVDDDGNLQEIDGAAE